MLKLNNKSDLRFQSDARNRIVKGVHQLSKAVSVTLGPKGKNVAIIKKGERPHLTKDGVTVANSINLEDPFENLGCQIVKEAAQRSADVAGDGTTTSTVIASYMLDEGHRLLETGYDARQVVAGIESGCSDVINALEESRLNLNTLDQLKSIATISANGEEKVGNLIAEAIEKVGPDGPITVENAKGFETQLDLVEGTVIDRGYLSPYFATDKNKGHAELKKTYILICNEVLASAQRILPFLELAASSNRSLLVVANDVSSEALQTLVLNKLKGTISVCAIKAPEFGAARSQALSDLAEVTGGKVLTEDEKVEKSELFDYFGFAEKVVTDKHGTLLIGTRGDKESVKSRIDHLTSELDSPGLQENEVGLLRRRIRRLSEGIAIIRVGGSTEGEMFERRDRVDDALCSAKSAKRSGIQPGGGTALMQAARKVSKRKNSSPITESFEAGYQAIIKACSVPLRQIVENTGEVPEIVLRKLQRSKKENYGYDASSESYGDMFEMKIIDPHDVVVSSLAHATSVVCNILMIGCAISISSDEGGESLGLLEEV